LLHFSGQPLKFKFGGDSSSTISCWDIGISDQIYQIKEARMLYPKMFKPKDMSFGNEVPIWILQGMWSEVGLAIRRSKVLGKSLVQLEVANTQSIFSRRGALCILL
jgi:hypothetical protein